MLLTVPAPDADTADHDAQVLLAAAGSLTDEHTREAVVRLAASLRASGLVIAVADEAVSPKDAGRMLGVSRQLVNRMLDDGQLPWTTKPGSSHKLIQVSDVLALEVQRRRANAAVDDLVAGLLADGDEY